jgi:protein TonB
MSYQALLFCPDDKTARVVTQVLSELDFTVEPCNEPFAAVKKLMAQHFDAIVVDCDNEQNAGLLFKSARNSNSNQNSLSVAVVEGQAGVAKAFRIGANLVLTKPINVEQSKGTLRVARGLLRKAESAKSPTGVGQEFAPKSPVPVNGPAHSSAPPPTSFSKPAAIPRATQAPLASASAAGLEIDPEPMPQPGPTEAALLESMSDPVPGKSSAQTAAGSRTTYPWQPVSKAAEPMGSALMHSAEAAGKGARTENTFPPNPQLGIEASAPSADLSSFGRPSGGGAASAPAPAREFVPPPPSVGAPTKESSPPTKSVIATAKPPAGEAPAFGDLAVKDHEEIEESHATSRKPILVMALVVVLAAAAYFGWSKFRPLVSGIMGAKPSIHAVTQPAPAAQQTVPTPLSPATALPQAAPAQSSTVVAATPDTHPLPATEVKANQPEVAPDVTTRVAPAGHAEQPIIVNSSPATSRPAIAAVEAPVPAAPPMLSVPGNSDTKQIAGIVSAGAVAMPKAAPQSLRVSQGVSQGLIVRKVSPVYPQQALQMHIQGAVQLAATVTKDGMVKNVKTLKGDSVLARAAADAVRQWKYKPYFLNGEPVEIQTEITVYFKLP